MAYAYQQRYKVGAQSTVGILFVEIYKVNGGGWKKMQYTAAPPSWQNKKASSNANVYIEYLLSTRLR